VPLRMPAKHMSFLGDIGTRLKMHTVIIKVCMDMGMHVSVSFLSGGCRDRNTFVVLL